MKESVLKMLTAVVLASGADANCDLITQADYQMGSLAVGKVLMAQESVKIIGYHVDPELRSLLNAQVAAGVHVVEVRGNYRPAPGLPSVIRLGNTVVTPFIVVDDRIVVVGSRVGTHDMDYAMTDCSEAKPFINVADTLIRSLQDER